MAATLLGYFKDNIKNAGRNTKYFNRAFLNTFIEDYNRSHAAGVADYTATAKTDFYIKNGGSYCTFLELWSEYKNGINYLNSKQEGR